MTQEINFYQIDDVYHKSIAPLLIKTLDEGKKAFLFCSDEDRLAEIDKGLWQFSKTKFVPHVTNKETDIEELSSWDRQPIVISDEEDNKNGADYLVLINEPSSDFIKKFNRIFYFYTDEQIDEAKKFAKNFTKDGQKVKSFKKSDGKWASFEI